MQPASAPAGTSMLIALGAVVPAPGTSAATCARAAAHSTDAGRPLWQRRSHARRRVSSCGMCQVLLRIAVAVWLLPDGFIPATDPAGALAPRGA